MRATPLGLLAAAVAAVVLSPSPAATDTARASRPQHHSHSHGYSDPAVITDWSRVAVATLGADAAAVPPRKTAIEAYLYLAFMHTAVYNAVVGIEGGYRPYRFHARPPRKASSEAAAAAAAHRILTTYSPEQTAALDAALATSLAGVPDGKAETRGVAYGVRAADAMIRQRVDDGRNDPTRTYDLLPGPGVWEPTPPALAPFSAPWLGYVDPLALRSGAQFDPGPPPSLTSSRYTKDFDEVKTYGALGATARTAEMTETATFFAGNPAVQFTNALADQARIRHLDIARAARLFGAVHAALADAAIAIWWTKHHYAFWRPITAIQRADTDGNPDTAPDPTWQSVIATPPYPDFVSGYSGVMGAFVHSLADVLGTRRLRLTLTTTAFPAGDPRATRYYARGREALAEVMDARVWLGLHFRFADVAAARMGQQVGHAVLDKAFQKHHHHHHHH
jgi:hypothetical protein